VGGTLQLSFYVPKDALIETVADLKGKRIPTDYPGTPIVRLSSTAALATAGFTYSDIVKVPVSDLQAGAQAFLEGRTDAGWHTVGSPAVEEANARKGGVKFVSVISTTEGARKMAEVYPGSYPRVLKAGSATAVIKDTAFLTSDYYLVASKDLSDEAAYEIIKALWEYNQELGAATAWSVIKRLFPITPERSNSSEKRGYGPRNWRPCRQNCLGNRDIDCYPAGDN
ncbi:MAG: ABC transporter substrate-binding protein, partial [Deltaproteobacteria bacterium]|nr:ABC transporter substrate-binding protein [Deltaproteobacteria bacterium]